MSTNIKKILKIFLLAALVLTTAFFVFFFVGSGDKNNNPQWGVNFSQKYTQYNLGLDWKKTYSSILDDLNVKYIRLPAYWDILEPQSGAYAFSDLDWQINQAAQKNVKIILVMGLKSPRWPECHIPSWAVNMGKDAQQNKILGLIKETVGRYKNNLSVEMWQVENEPFLDFGDCPWQADAGFLKKEIGLIKSLDSSRLVMLTESGEWSLWFKTAPLADIIGVTLYRKVYMSKIKIYIDFPLPAVYYQRRAWLINKIWGKGIMGVELQGEPWFLENSPEVPRAEWEKTMSLNQFKSVISYAKKTGISRFYFFGAEWWYWLKEKHNDSSFWEEAKKLFSDNFKKRL